MRSRHRRLRYELLETRDLLATVQIADGIVGHPSERVTVPVNIDDATGVRAAEIRIEYDTAQLDVQRKDIAAGSAWAGTAVAIANVDQHAGAIVVFVFSTESLAGGSGSVIDVSFTIRSDALPNEAAIDLAKVRLNEGQIELTGVPQVGADTTDGSITIQRDTIQRDTIQRDTVPQDHRFAQEHLMRACVVERRPDSQALVSQPAPPITTTVHPLPAALTDKPVRMRRESHFIGPTADMIFAAQEDWLRGIYTAR
ncbi:MAG TPA: cohesin domain-containing protein [Pirellulaceae bacterium]|nr:cohesin domain-containing protein [Pirellulaceae bacterium]